MAASPWPENAGTAISDLPLYKFVYIFSYTYSVYEKHKDVRMDIIFKAAKLRKLANEKKHRDRKLGTEMSGNLGRRLDQLRAAPTLDDMPNVITSYSIHYTKLYDRSSQGLPGVPLQGP